MIIRSHKNKNYTTMSNYHLNDSNLSLKSKGLLSFMLSKPDVLDFSISGLKSQLKEGREAIRMSLIELEQIGYLRRDAIRSEKGAFATIEYHIYEKPMSQNPNSVKFT